LIPKPVMLLLWLFNGTISVVYVLCALKWDWKVTVSYLK
jgi:hypothetical protein